jgi:lipopolysaccharide transport system ATP-binding protein
MSSENGGTSGHAIVVSEVGKAYRIYDRPEDRLKQALFRRRRYYRDFWALRGVSITIERGDAVGIVGRNGSGKSTLLQIIAGTMAPTEGEVRIDGRISALLELGSGFNPDFTGRENVYLNGAILGISRAEMERRFDDIAAFADIGPFIDQPVKTYSSGMHARLAFSVAISVDPDILIVDEILSVGDMGFQQKCLARMRRLRENGLTMLFVSHVPDAVRSVCNRALLLGEGRAIYSGSADQAVNLYLSHVREQTNREALAAPGDGTPVAFRRQLNGQTRYGSGQVQIEHVELLDRDGAPCRAYRFRDEIVLEATLRSYVEADNVSVSFLVRDMTGVDLMGTTTFDERVTIPRLQPGETARVRFRFQNHLRLGNFGVCLAIHRVSERDYSDNVLCDQVDGCAAFAVIADPGRPVHYKFHQPVSVEVDLPDRTDDVLRRRGAGE